MSYSTCLIEVHIIHQLIKMTFAIITDAPEADEFSASPTKFDFGVTRPAEMFQHAKQLFGIEFNHSKTQS